MRMGELIPKPRSKFLRVKCPKCGNEQTAFDRASMALSCNVCEEPLLIPKGGKAEIKAEVVQELG